MPLPTGEVLTLKVLRLYHCADIQGYGAQLLVRAHKDSAFPVPGMLVPKERLDDPDAAGAYGWTTEENVLQVGGLLRRGMP